MRVIRLHEDTETSLGENGENKVIVIRKFVLVNVTASPVTVQIYKVPSGGMISGDDWKLFKDYSLAALETWDVRECAKLQLENGDSLRVMAGTASAVRCGTLDYLEES